MTALVTALAAVCRKREKPKLISAAVFPTPDLARKMVRQDWDNWLSKKSGPKVAAREPGAGALPAIEDAPGSYVKVRSGK